MSDAVTILDVTRDVCPITFVRTKLELEDLPVGAVLEVLLNEGESLENVARSTAGEGHEILGREPVSGRVWRLRIRRGADR